MARTYWIRGTTTAADADTLSAHMCQTLCLGNVEAAYEVASWDLCVMHEELYLPGAGSGAQWCAGPYWVPVHYDRDGALRDLGISIFAASGATALKTFRVVATDYLREPIMDGAADDPYFEATTNAPSAIPEWVAEETLALDERGWTGLVPRDFADTDESEPVWVQGVWVSVYVTSPTADTSYGGMRVREIVEV